jgi:ABC-type dipeptide/oligopeptide/nickel transport system permease subunit
LTRVPQEVTVTDTPESGRRRVRWSWPLLATRVIPRGVTVALLVLAALVVIAVFASLIAPHDPDQIFSSNVLQEPSMRFPMGTDDLGRDELSRVLVGTRVSLRVGVTTTLLALAVGAVLALAAAMGGRWLDTIIMRCCDVLLAFPGLLLALAVVAALGPGLQHALYAVAVSLVPGYARTVRSLIFGVRQRDFVLASRALGGGKAYAAVHHVLPNIVGGLIVLITLGTALVTLEVSSLSFIGLGAQPPQAEWGSMLAEARQYIDTAWWLTVFPAAAISVTVLSVNVIGDWLRDMFDPRKRVVVMSSALGAARVGRRASRRPQAAR